MEKALAGLLNAASAGEEVRGALVTRISECASFCSPQTGIPVQKADA